MNDKPEAVAWLYVHHEFGREVHLMRFDAETGGTSDDYIGWAEIRLVPEAASSSQDASALVEALATVRTFLVGSDPLHSSNGIRNLDLRSQVDAALTAWEAQHG